MLRAVTPPDITYKPHLAPEIVGEGRLSDIQLERVIYAGQRHEQRLPDESRAGFFVGDGTGVGKGRVLAKTKSCLQETKTAFHTACRLAGIEGLIWKDLRATFGTRLAEAGCDAFTIAQLLGHSDVRVTMRYVRILEDSKRVVVEAMKLTSGKVGHVLATWPKQPPLPAAVNG